jgi:hypothetical protein
MELAQLIELIFEACENLSRREKHIEAFRRV